MKPAYVVIGALAVFTSWRVWSGMDKNTSPLESFLVGANLIGAQAMGTEASKMDISEGGITNIATREGFSAKKYPDASGFSIGYGHFIKTGESFTEPMSMMTARELLRNDAQTAADAVRAYVKVPLSKNQFDALTSFVYNVGAGAFKRSSMLKQLNVGDYSAAASQFDMWHKPAIVTARRDSEKAQFLA